MRFCGCPWRHPHPTLLRGPREDARHQHVVQVRTPLVALIGAPCRHHFYLSLIHRDRAPHRHPERRRRLQVSQTPHFSHHHLTQHPNLTQTAGKYYSPDPTLFTSTPDPARIQEDSRWSRSNAVYQPWKPGMAGTTRPVAPPMPLWDYPTLPPPRRKRPSILPLLPHHPHRCFLVAFPPPTPPCLLLCGENHPPPRLRLGN